MSQVLAFINPRLTTQNVGDVFIEDSVKRILDYDREHSIEIDPRLPITSKEIDRVNATAAAVIVGTNLWYRDMPKPGRWQFSLSQLKRIRVPVIPLGVGTTRHGDDNIFERETADQIRLIHNSCTVGSARDWRTVEALRQAGITNVSMTGCPTLYRSLKPDWELRTNQSESRKPKAESRGLPLPAFRFPLSALRSDHSKQVVVTVRKGQRHNVWLLVRRVRELGLRPVVAAQQHSDRFLRYSLPFVQRAVPTVYRYDIQPYLRLVEESIGVVGWRLHGNMLHLAHGKPAVYFANCSRAASFCESFGLPCVRCPDHQRLSPAVIHGTVDRLFDPATFAGLRPRYAEYRSSMVAFLDANGLQHHLVCDVGPTTAIQTPAA